MARSNDRRRNRKAVREDRLRRHSPRPFDLARLSHWRIALAAIGLTAIAIAASYFAGRNDESSRDRLLAQAAQAYVRGLFGVAQRDARVISDRDPSNRAAALLAGRALLKINRPAEAEVYLDRARPIDPGDSHALALAYTGGGASGGDKAASVYEEILKNRPGDVLAMRRLAAIRISQNRLGDARELADRLIATPGGEVVGYTLKGVVEHDVNDPNAAAPAFERVLRLDPELREMPLQPKSMFWSYLADDLLSIGRATDARRYLIEAMKTGREPTLVSLLGRAHRLEGDAGAAEACWKEAAEADPRLSSPWINLGRLALERGKLEEAIEYLRKASDLVPEAPEPYYSLSLAHRRLGRSDEADRLLRKSEELKKKAPEPRGGMGAPPSR